MAEQDKSSKATAASSSSAVESTESKKRKRMFSREVKMMLYGFGDVVNPLSETVDLAEDLVVEYMEEMTKKAIQRTHRQGNSRMKLQDLIDLIKEDKKKCERARNLVHMHDVVAKAKKAVDVDEMIKGIAAEEGS
eukprot:GILK01007850.1.p1 GENE.GILK01007850.1~~GILK01007850.1.p1  ORF type:complete len:145 (+),score=35.17 GILK01007850.1:33-437(+)